MGTLLLWIEKECGLDFLLDVLHHLVDRRCLIAPLRIIHRLHLLETDSFINVLQRVTLLVHLCRRGRIKNDIRQRNEF